MINNYVKTNFGSKVAENNINKEMQLWSQTKIKHTLNLNQMSVALLLAPTSSVMVSPVSPDAATFPMTKTTKHKQQRNKQPYELT